MSESYLGSGLSGQAGDDAVLPQPLAAAPQRRRATDRIAEGSGALTRFEQEQLAREFADGSSSDFCGCRRRWLPSAPLPPLPRLPDNARAAQ
jgi:hypothetical protein